MRTKEEEEDEEDEVDEENDEDEVGHGCDGGAAPAGLPAAAPSPSAAARTQRDDQPCLIYLHSVSLCPSRHSKPKR